MTITSSILEVPTYVSGSGVFVGKLVELPGSHGVHLDEGDAAAAPLFLRFVDGEKGLKEQVHDPFGYGLRVYGQAGHQVVHAAHIPELDTWREVSNALKPLITGLFYLFTIMSN